MKGQISKTEIEIGFDEEGLYFEAGSPDALWAFLGLLLKGSESAITYLETRTVTYQEVEMADIEKTIVKNRSKFIEIITNVIESSGIRLIEDREDAAMLAVHIVDGLENEAERQRMPDAFRVAIKCPDCEVVQEGYMFLGVASKIVIRCAECKHEAPLSEFRKETSGYGGKQ